jgi:hypothetical protein
MATLTARKLGISPDEVLVASTLFPARGDMNWLRPL